MFEDGVVVEGIDLGEEMNLVETTAEKEVDDDKGGGEAIGGGRGGGRGGGGGEEEAVKQANSIERDKHVEY